MIDLTKDFKYFELKAMYYCEIPGEDLARWKIEKYEPYDSFIFIKFRYLGNQWLWGYTPVEGTFTDALKKTLQGALEILYFTVNGLEEIDILTEG